MDLGNSPSGVKPIIDMLVRHRIHAHPVLDLHVIELLNFDTFLYDIRLVNSMVVNSKSIAIYNHVRLPR